MITNMRNAYIMLFAGLTCCLYADAPAPKKDLKKDRNAILVDITKSWEYREYKIALSSIESELQEIMATKRLQAQMRDVAEAIEALRQEIGTNQPTAEQREKQDKHQEKAAKLMTQMRVYGSLMQRALKIALRKLAGKLQALHQDKLVLVTCTDDVTTVQHSNNDRIKELLELQKRLHKLFLKYFEKAYRNLVASVSDQLATVDDVKSDKPPKKGQKNKGEPVQKESKK